MGCVFNLNFFFCHVAGVTLQAGQRAEVLDSPLLAVNFCLKIGINCISFLNYSPKQTASNHTNFPLVLGFACLFCSSNEVHPPIHWRFAFGRACGAIRHHLGVSVTQELLLVDCR